MALYISYKLDSGITSEFRWNIGEKIPYNVIDNATEVQADDHELEFIINNFKNIPYRNYKKVIRWHGDIAKFIVSNLL